MSSPILEAENLSFSYPGSEPLISNWSVEFQAGSTVAITGPSGRGKSTLLYILGLMLAPRSGRVLLDGDDVTTLRDRDRAAHRARSFGFVFQDAALDATRTVLDNVLETTLYRNERRAFREARALELLETFGVRLRADAKPGEVSGGQAQRIALARALLNEPRVILADEPTGNLDPVSSALVMSAFHERAAQGSTVIIVTHDPTVVAACDVSIRL